MNNTGEKIDIFFATGSALPWETVGNEIYYHPDLSFLLQGKLLILLIVY